MEYKKMVFCSIEINPTMGCISENCTPFHASKLWTVKYAFLSVSFAFIAGCTCCICIYFLFSGIFVSLLLPLCISTPIANISSRCILPPTVEVKPKVLFIPLVTSVCRKCRCVRVTTWYMYTTRKVTYIHVLACCAHTHTNMMPCLYFISLLPAIIGIVGCMYKLADDDEYADFAQMASLCAWRVTQFYQPGL